MTRQTQFGCCIHPRRHTDNRENMERFKNLFDIDTYKVLAAWFVGNTALLVNIDLIFKIAVSVVTIAYLLKKFFEKPKDK